MRNYIYLTLAVCGAIIWLVLFEDSVARDQLAGRIVAGLMFCANASIAAALWYKLKK